MSYNLFNIVLKNLFGLFIKEIAKPSLCVSRVKKWIIDTNGFKKKCIAWLQMLFVFNELIYQQNNN